MGSSRPVGALSPQSPFHDKLSEKGTGMSEAQPSKAIVVLTTASGEKEAGVIARVLVEKQLAACVQIVPAIRSIYSWKGEIVDDGESLLLVKTLRSRFEEVRVAIREAHSYDLPEVVALSIDPGDDEYLAWIAGCVGMR
jgi:periplasmic divalent cation tolerance protein